MNKLYTIIISIFVISLLFLVGFTSWNVQSDDGRELFIEHEEPVAISFDQIKQRGSIRMITRYSSSSYFIHRGLDRGFEYDFISEFARRNGLRVEVVVLKPDENPIDVLNRGDGDIIAANYTRTSNREDYISFSSPYNLVDQVLVIPAHKFQLDLELNDLLPLEITVRRNSSYHATLLSLIEQGYRIKINTVNEDWDTEAIINGVADGQFEATVADHNLFQAASLFAEGLAQGPVLSERNEVAWGIRKNNPELLSAANTFLEAQFRVSEDLRPRRSGLLNMLTRRYFEDNNSLRDYRDPEFDFYHTGRLSPYDDMVKSIAAEADVDWKFVISVMNQESRFDPNAKSWMGAVGLMQILPRFSQVPSEELLFDPETNIREGVRYIRKHLDRYQNFDRDTQHRLALATYNAGIGHVNDARRLAIDLGNDPNNWDDIADALLKLMNRRYYANARYGYVRGTETVNYVERIMYHYEKIQNITLLAEYSRSHS